MARQLDEILKELDAGYNPGRQLINERLNALPGQAEAEISGLKAQESDYFNNTIMAGARNRGVAFGGIPEGERAQYGASTFLPAVARVKQSQNDVRSSLQGALNDIGLDQRKTAVGIYQGELDRDEQRRQFDAQLAAQRATASAGRINPTMGGNATPALATQRKDKGFEFKDTYGNPISAAAYSAATGIPFRQLLQTMANQGDAGAKQALGFVGDDYGYDPRAVNNSKLADLYNSLVWGTGKQASPYNGLSVSNAPPTQRLTVR